MDYCSQPKSTKQVANQQWKTGNAALLKNFESSIPPVNLENAMWYSSRPDPAKEKPVRVIRNKIHDSAVLKRAAGAQWKPAEGCRYDGLYRVVNAYTAIGKAGFWVCRFHLERLEGQPPIPETEHFASKSQKARTSATPYRRPDQRRPKSRPLTLRDLRAPSANDSSLDSHTRSSTEHTDVKQESSSHASSSRVGIVYPTDAQPEEDMDLDLYLDQSSPSLSSGDPERDSTEEADWQQEFSPYAEIAQPMIVKAEDEEMDLPHDLFFPPSYAGESSEDTDVKQEFEIVDLCQEPVPAGAPTGRWEPLPSTWNLQANRWEPSPISGREG
ncbi:PUA-like domain-containing protein [Pterulicium gracile]|uniref:PUA-like domain-containing protein n=1 Tax=Pterulicium gracile TaxID=1884261 RepID=A0A5C3QTM0_9AGAR|nr:PUA-like domain-containing protein [Pterula gracilis]